MKRLSSVLLVCVFILSTLGIGVAAGANPGEVVPLTEAERSLLLELDRSEDQREPDVEVGAGAEEIFPFAAPKTSADVPGDWTAKQRVLDSKGDSFVSLSNFYPESVTELFQEDPVAFQGLPAWTKGTGRMSDVFRARDVTARFSTNAEVMGFLRKLESSPSNTVMTLRVDGEFPAGLEFPVLVFSRSKSAPSAAELFQKEPDKPTVLLQGPIHGNEQSAGEGLMFLAKRLVEGHPDVAGLLDRISIVMIPHYNVDGMKVYQRGTTLLEGATWQVVRDASKYAADSNFDMNRDGIWLDAPISRVVAKVQSEFLPHVIADHHEYGNGGRYFLPELDTTGNYVVSGDKYKLGYGGVAQRVYWQQEITTMFAVNLNVPQTIRDLAENLFEKNIEKDLNAKGYRWAPYIGGGTYGMLTNRKATGSASEDYYVSTTGVAKGGPGDSLTTSVGLSTEGGFDPGIGRNTGGLMPAVSFLIEARSGLQQWEMPRRAMAQYLTALSILKTTADNAQQTLDTVREARRIIVEKGKTVTPDDQVVVTMQYPGNALVEPLPCFDEEGKPVALPRIIGKARKGVPELTRTRPYAYIIDKRYHLADEIVERLKIRGAKVDTLKNAHKLKVEVFTVLEAQDTKAYGNPSVIDKTRVEVKTLNFPAGCYVVYMAQLAGAWIPQALEPESMRSFAGKAVSDPSKLVGFELPFYRYMQAIPLITKEEKPSSGGGGGCTATNLYELGFLLILAALPLVKRNR